MPSQWLRQNFLLLMVDLVVVLAYCLLAVRSLLKKVFHPRSSQSGAGHP